MSNNSNSFRLTTFVLGALLFLLIGFVLGALIFPESRQLILNPLQQITAEPGQSAEIAVVNEVPTVEKEVIIEAVEEIEAEPVAKELEVEEAAQVGDIEATVEGTPVIPALNSPRANEQLQETLIDLYKRTNPSVVRIFALAQNVGLGSGTGFVIDNQGHILTNNHVIQSAEKNDKWQKTDKGCTNKN